MRPRTAVARAVGITRASAATELRGGFCVEFNFFFFFFASFCFALVLECPLVGPLRQHLVRQNEVCPALRASSIRKPDGVQIPPRGGQQEVHLPLSPHVGCLVPSGPPVTYRCPDFEEGGSEPACGDLCGHPLPCSCCWMLASTDPAVVVTLTPRGPWELSGRAQAGRGLHAE